MQSALNRGCSKTRLKTLALHERALLKEDHNNKLHQMGLADRLAMPLMYILFIGSASASFLLGPTLSAKRKMNKQIDEVRPSKESVECAVRLQHYQNLHLPLIVLKR